MADTIAIMNQGVIEQLGAPQEVYDRPASVFVADFIGSPSMNFLPFDGGYAAGVRQVRLGDAVLAVPELREDAAVPKLLYGVRPEHVRFAGDSVGLAFDSTQVSLFDAASGRALRTIRHEASTPTRASHRGASALGAAHG